MTNKTKLISKLLELLTFIPDENLKLGKDSARLLLSNSELLLDISSAGIVLPCISLPDIPFGKGSPLKDDFIPTVQFKSLFAYLKANNLFQRLNHLGICYQVESVKTEKERLLEEVKKTRLHLYEEESADESAWLFIGDRTNWQDPLVELVLTEGTNDKWQDYWLPHIQIDIDTFLNGDEIEKLILKTFKGKVRPFRLLETEKFIILTRARLGIISGVNIALDLGFEGRMSRYHRTKLLKKLV